MNDPILNPVQEKKKPAKIMTIIGWFVGFALISGVVNGLLPKESETAKAASQRNSFVSSCKTSAYKVASDRDYETICGCAYDRLNAHYNGRFNDETDRILTSGYNSAETDIVASCL